MLGEPGESDSTRGVEAPQAELDGIPFAIDAAKGGLHGAFREVHEALSSIKELQRAAYEPATQFVESNQLAKGADLGFDVEFRARDFTNRWIDMVNRQRLGQFHDMTRHDRDEVSLGGVDLDRAEDVLTALDGIVDRLSREGGRSDGAPRSLDVVMRSGHSPADLLTVIYGLDWLHSQYIIRAGGAELSELSPGQRGLVLLLFYLLVDKSERPLLLDQPEENIDNQTVRNVLVPALQEAVRRRQVIAVTHNPNLAVVGDADQIIVATFNRHFSYRSGSLAELQIGHSTIDVLEGTREAFASRNEKYTDVVGKGTRGPDCDRTPSPPIGGRVGMPRLWWVNAVAVGSSRIASFWGHSLAGGQGRPGECPRTLGPGRSLVVSVSTLQRTRLPERKT